MLPTSKDRRYFPFQNWKPNLRTRRLAGIRRETFEELLKSEGIPCQYFNRRSFATWDVLLSSEELAASNVSTNHFKLQPEYRGTRQIKVTVCSVPVQLNGDVLAACMSVYGSVEEVTTMRSVDRTAHGEFVLNICLYRDGFQAIPHMLTCRDQQMKVVIEGRRLFCWSCEQLGPLSRTYQQKSTINSNNNINSGKTTCPTTNPALEPGNHQKKPEEVCTQVTRKGKTLSHKTTEPATEATTQATTTETTTEKATKPKPPESAASVQPPSQPPPQPHVSKNPKRKPKRTPRKNSLKR